MTDFKQPGTVVGVIGNGIKALRLIDAAHKMGMKVVVLVEDEADVAASRADIVLVGSRTDAVDLARLAAVSEVVTYADETVNSDALASVVTTAQLPSGVGILQVTQDRYLQKVFLDDLNVNILPYAQVIASDDLAKAVEEVGFPALLKPIQKGIGTDQQLLLETTNDVLHATKLLQQRPYVLEAWLRQPREIAVTVIKTEDQVVLAPIIEARVEAHELRAAIAPARLPEAVSSEATRIAQLIAQQFDYIGAFGIEFFVTETGAIYVKRLFPGLALSSAIFVPTAGMSVAESHWRALLGWPIPLMGLVRPGVMLPLRERDRAQAYTQLQIKPQWQFQFYPDNPELLGTATIIGDEKDVAEILEATDYFRLDNKEETDDSTL